MKNVVSVIVYLNFIGLFGDVKLEGIILTKKLGKNWKFKYFRLIKKLE